MSVYGLVYMYVQSQEECIIFPVVRVTGSYKPADVVLNSGPLHEQYILLVLSPCSSLLHIFSF